MKADQFPASAFVESGAEALVIAVKSHQLSPTQRTTLKQVYFGWPNLEEATLKLAALLGSRLFDAKGKLLLGKCVSVAVKAYEAAHDSARHESSVASAYLDGLIRTAAELVHHDVYGLAGGRSELWNPSTEALTVFAARFEKLQIVPVEASQDMLKGAQMILASRIMRIEDASLISTAQSEACRDCQSKSKVIPITASAA